MNRPTLAVVVLELLKREPLRPSFDELLEALPDVTPQELVRALEELHDLAQIGAAPAPEGGKNSE